MSEVVPNIDNPWQTPSADIDPELVETSQRLMAKSEVQAEVPEPSVTTVTDPRIAVLEDQVQHLLRRNANLVARVAQLESVNESQHSQLLALRQAAQRPWWRRLLGS